METTIMRSCRVSGLGFRLSRLCGLGFWACMIGVIVMRDVFLSLPKCLGLQSFHCLGLRRSQFEGSWFESLGLGGVRGCRT